MGVIKVKVMGEEKDIEKGTSLRQLSQEYEHIFSYPIVIARVNNRLQELHKQVNKECEIEFLDLTSREGNRIYVNGLVFVMIYAVKQLFGDKSDICVQHSIDKGLYIETNFDLTVDVINKIKQKMAEIIESDLPITKIHSKRDDAIEYFKKIGDASKVGIMKYNTNTYVTLYRLDNIYNYFYNYMPSSTGKLTYFDLTYLNTQGCVLRFPTIYNSNIIKEYVHHENMFITFRQCRQWGKIMGIADAKDLNSLVSNGNIKELIRIDETLQNNRLLEIAKEINAKKDNLKIVLIAGPSSSGKTTTTNKLCMYLKSFGLKPKMLSMDNYYLDLKDRPRDVQGQIDFENLQAIDLNLFNRQVEQLLNGEEIINPEYNFSLGIKEYNKKLQLGQGEILLIEGIHCLNEKILTNIPDSAKYKIYISAITELNIDKHNRISTTDHRLLRRIIRDNLNRGFDVVKTLSVWPNVRNGEENNIFPYQDNADVIFNTALIYEIGVLKTYVEPLLYSVDTESKYYEEAKRLLNFLRLFLPISSEDVPKDSILREFIGGSCFKD